MTQQLREALHDLAEEEPGPAVSGDDLWRRGRRAARRRRAATAAAVVAVVVVVAGGVPVVDSLRTTAPGPAAPRPGTEASVPDQLWSPRPWTPGTAQTGPPGRLAAIAIGDRERWWPGTGELGVLGVTTEDQTYRWLDLPDRADSPEAQTVTLSPDGRKVGYFLGGTPSASFTQSDVTGYAVYDVVSGEVSRREFSTRHGLAVRNDALAWSGDSEWLVCEVGQYISKPNQSDHYRVEAWRPGTDDRVTVDAWGDDSGYALAPAPEGVARWRGKKLQTAALPSGAVQEQRYPGGSGSLARVHLSVNPDGGRLAWSGGWAQPRGGERLALHMAQVGEEPAARMPSTVPQWYPQGILGWFDADTLVLAALNVAAYRGPGQAPPRILAVDVTTGDVRPAIARPGSDDEMHGVQLATDLLADGLAPGQAPGWHAPPWPVTLAGLLLLGGLGWLVRRALRRRGERALETRDAAGPAGAEAS